MLRCDPVNLGAVLVLLRGQSQKVSDLIKRKPQIPAAPNEPQPAHVFLVVNPVVSSRAGGNRQKPNLLVIPDGDNFGPGGLRQISDTQSPFCIHRLTL